MNQELTDIINKIKEKFTDDSDLLWTCYDSAKEVRDELDACIDQLTKGNKNCLEKLNMHFLPTSTFQEHSLQNGWADEYLKFADDFDRVYAEMKNHS